jgi:hypothetical protein
MLSKVLVFAGAAALAVAAPMPEGSKPYPKEGRLVRNAVPAGLCDTVQSESGESAARTAIATSCVPEAAGIGLRRHGTRVMLAVGRAGYPLVRSLRALRIHCARPLTVDIGPTAASLAFARIEQATLRSTPPPTT